MQFRISLRKLKKALTRLTDEQKDQVCSNFGIQSNTKNSANIYLDFSCLVRETGEAVAEKLIEACTLTSNQELIISSFLSRFTSNNLESVSFNTAKELFNALKYLNGHFALANIAVRMGSRLYPANAQVSYNSSEHGGYCSVTVQFNVGQYPNLNHHTINAGFFSPPVAELSDWEREPVDLLKWLSEHNLAPLTTQIIENTSKKLEKIERLKQKVQMICLGQCIQIHHNWFGTHIEESQFGSLLHPEKVITDTNFELGEPRFDDYGNCGVSLGPVIPLVRVFSLRTKKYVLADVGDLEEYHYDTNAITRLVIPDKMRDILQKIFSNKEELFADVISGKHGGMVIMANGKPGVGKTLTAEIMSEYTERPLYVMELGELGTNLLSVEKTLDLIFKRVTRWNALLLFDEADIFLHKRDSDLERNAIVGIFLRLLDYFPGVMFLTTNRGEVIDHAVKSRVTIKLDYPDLTPETREKIWKVMFRLVGQELESAGELPQIEINGRQIRNLMRLAVCVHGKTVTPEQVQSLSEFTAK